MRVYYLMNKQLSIAISAHYNKHFQTKFIPGKSAVPVSGKMFDVKELEKGVQAVLDGWWTEGRYAQEFEKKFGHFLGVKYVSLVNSGSSANLVALSALTTDRLGERALRPGDEIITCATGFPTTINPILQNNCIPVFVDADLKTKNPSPVCLERAITQKTKAIMLAHTLGNLLPLDAINILVKRYNLWFIEDCCDALGGTYYGKNVSTFGHIATFSFYPAHQITMGEGGAVITNNPLLHMAIRQFRDWGRDCWCDTGKDDTCRRRFRWKLGELPMGYDHKYIYSQIGYNMKLSDMQAAIGLAQLKKLPKFITRRRKNFQKLYNGLLKYSEYLEFTETEKGSEPCWFGFMILVRDNAPFTKIELVQFLESKHVATRSLFGGNITRHPAYLKRKKDIRIVGTLKNSDNIMKNGFWIGIYPALTAQMIKYVMQTFDAFMEKHIES